ncbi:MAG: class I SAM-dependent methyltransferase [Planctomycetes bacterium]|nr:class I SAM-dependent methyltransferase [Planctomycetota bacterium]
MDHAKFSAIGHGQMRYWNPIHADVFQQWIDSLKLTASSSALDVGCGRAELLKLIANRFGCACLGVDSSAAATEMASEIVPVDLRCTPFQAGDFDAGKFDLIACIGSTHAVGDLETTLQVLGQLLAPDGEMWLGIGYWQRPPEPGYLDFLQCDASEMMDHAGNLQSFDQAGWRVVGHHLTTAAEWSEYEDGYAQNLYRYIAAHPEDADTAAIKKRIDGWRRAYLQWGHHTMGFGVYRLQQKLQF